MIKQKKVEKVENIEERFKHGRSDPRLSSVQERKLVRQFQEKSLGYSLRPVFQTPLDFLETKDNILKILYKYCSCNILESIHKILEL
jgi:hypothetical protein